MPWPKAVNIAMVLEGMTQSICLTFSEGNWQLWAECKGKSKSKEASEEAVSCLSSSDGIGQDEASEEAVS